MFLRNFCRGNEEQTRIVADHEPAILLESQSTLSRRHARWCLGTSAHCNFLFEFVCAVASIDRCCKRCNLRKTVAVEVKCIHSDQGRNAFIRLLR